MEGEELTGVEAGSPPASVEPGSQAPAGAENTEQVAQGQQQGKPQGQQVPYARFAQVIQQNKQLEARLAQVEQLQQRAAQQGGQLSPQDQAQYREAASALRKVMESDPTLAALLKIAADAPKLTQTMQGVESLTKSQQQAQVQQGASYVKTLAEKAGLPVSNQKFASHLVRMVAQEALALPDGEARYDAGDMTVLEEAFANVQKEVFGDFTRAANAKLLKTKQATANLPPAPRGGFAGQPAPAKPVPGKEREYTQELHRSALKVLEDRLTG